MSFELQYHRHLLRSLSTSSPPSLSATSSSSSPPTSENEKGADYCQYCGVVVQNCRLSFFSLFICVKQPTTGCH
ncbi:hypothetical protein KSS87_022942, partial [Heliosperma pusillum]